MSTRDRQSLARGIAAVAVAVAATTALAGCAAVPDSNAGVATGRPTATDKRLDAAVAASGSGSRVAAWYRQVGPDISAVERTVAHAQRVVRNPGHRGLHETCEVLQTRVRRVQAAHPLPDRVARQALAREMADLGRGATHCIDDELLAAGRATNEAHYWSRVADARILAVLRHTS